MTIYLKQSTASQEVPLGYFVDSTDGNTEETALTIANTDIKIWKAGATTLANKNSGGATHISNGIYYAVLDATDTDTLGSMVIFVHVSGALTVRLECVVLAANVYDSIIGGGDLLDVQVTTTDQNAIADALLGRNVSGGSSTGRTVKQALHFIRNKWVVSGATLTVYDTDDTTSSWTASVTGTAGADPITGNDPS